MKLSSNSLTINKQIYDFLNEIDYGMSVNQLSNLYSLIEGAITLKGTKSIRRISNNAIEAPGESALYKYLKKSEWKNKIIEHNRLSFLSMFFDNNVKSKEPGFLIIDDTVNPKKKAKSMEGLSFNHSHTEGKRIKSHCIVSSQFVCGSISMPLNYQLYLSKENCTKFNREFKGKSDIAIDIINNFNKPTNCNKIYSLVDSWYSSERLIKNCLANQMHLIGAIRSNRLITPNFVRMQVGQFFKALPKEIFDVVTVKDSRYKTYEFNAKLGKSDLTVKVVLSYEIKKNDDVIPIYLISTDTSLSAKEIISYYLNRWNIEVSYKHFKTDLGFDEYKIRSLKAIERYLLIVHLAMNFLQVYRYRNNISYKTLGECIEDIIRTKFKSIVDFIYHASACGCPLGQVYKSLKI
jgi:SRSO17 transposase